MTKMLASLYLVSDLEMTGMLHSSCDLNRIIDLTGPMFIHLHIEKFRSL